MASNEMKIPTIDLCKPDLKPGTKQWDTTKAQVLKALQEWGCFEAKYDKIPSEIREAMFGVFKEIFEFPIETKVRNFSKKPFHGYVGQVPGLPLYESMCIADLLQHESVENFANIFWPDGNPDFCNVVRSYTKPQVELDEMVKRMVLECLGLNNYIDQLLDTQYYRIRLSHYMSSALQVDDDDVNKTGLSVHTDFGFLTIISQNQVNGLQILNKNNGDWIDVNISPNSFVVISGDSLMAWTNGRLHSPIHRVTMARGKDRCSIQLFSQVKHDCIIEAPKELVDEEHPLLFKPFDLSGYFEFSQTKGGQIAASEVFKAYCSV
ncbi:hypothetical protein HAX54_046153 [Datura stramonium]|uniref:Fe2OG dioxygenase domain-containing protein n=1 Tax=Datura stramonium TaxID=4076 RepID=A0ABS8WKD3_DATST|nr:hypothetical protein [Datura stramonium]